MSTTEQRNGTKPRKKRGNKMKYSKNAKLNKALSSIADDLIDLGIDEIIRYRKDFPNESDYNIAEYGNMLVYYSDIFEFYRACGYKSTDKFSCEKVWETYKRQVGYVAREIIKEYSRV